MEASRRLTTVVDNGFGQFASLSSGFTSEGFPEDHVLFPGKQPSVTDRAWHKKSQAIFTSRQWKQQPVAQSGQPTGRQTFHEACSSKRLFSCSVRVAQAEALRRVKTAISAGQVMRRGAPAQMPVPVPT